MTERSRARSFESLAELYDEVRPRYPHELYDRIDAAIGGLAGRSVLDLAAGTGIATRALLQRGATVVSVDPGIPMLTRLRSTAPAALVAAAVAEAIPCRDDSFDLVTCATGWHWFRTGEALPEISRVTRRGGHLALWWANHAWADGTDWERAQSEVYDRWDTEHGSRPGQVDGVGPKEAAADLRNRGFDVVVDERFRWTREVSREHHVRTIATHSDVSALGDDKPRFLAEVAAALRPWPVVTERLEGPLVVARIAS